MAKLETCGGKGLAQQESKDALLEGLEDFLRENAEQRLCMAAVDVEHFKLDEAGCNWEQYSPSMRVTLRQQQEEEAKASAKVKNLITEMSHDLRTPLTTLLLYTEIVRSRKYENDAQKDDYLNKIDTKARQLKQLSDNLFEYALVTRDTVVTLDPPAYFSRIFKEPLAEMVDTLQQRGFACALDLGSET